MPDVPELERRFVVLAAKPRYTVNFEEAVMPPAIFTQVISLPLLLLSIQAGMIVPLA